MNESVPKNVVQQKQQGNDATATTTTTSNASFLPTKTPPTSQAFNVNDLDDDEDIIDVIGPGGGGQKPNKTKNAIDMETLTSQKDEDELQAVRTSKSVLLV